MDPLGNKTWDVICGDSLEVLRQLPADCASLVFGSPPYRLARTYGIDFKLADQAWVDWMVEYYRAAQAACIGMVAFVVEGQTDDFRWTAEPALLMADLHRAGFNLRKPPVFYRIGIPGSGGPDYLRNDWEFIVCTTRPGKLPWSDNTSCGHAPKWAPGGEMSYRNSDGTRRNQWGGGELSTGGERDKGGERRPAGRPSHKIVNGRNQWGGTPHEGSGEGRNADGTYKGKKHKFLSMTSRGKDGERKIAGGRRVTRGKDDGDTVNEDAYDPPAIANPGNVIQQTYTAEEVNEIIGHGNVKKCLVGGGVMGSPLAHKNEAPFPESLVELFILSFCPPGGLVIDPFSGSGTTGAVAVRHGRRFLGIDVRESQVKLSRQRISQETPLALLAE